MADVVENVGAELSFAEAQAEWLAARNPQTVTETPAESTENAAAEDAPAGAKPEDGTAEESATPEEHANENDEQEQEGDKPGKPSKLEKRFAKLTKTIRELEQENARWREEATKSAAKPPEQKTEAPAATDNDAEPEPKEGESAAEYVKRYTKWQLAQERKAAERATAEAAAKETRDKAAQVWNEREAKAKEQFAGEELDYDEAVTDFVERANARKVAVSQAMKDFVNESEFGPQLLYKIATMKDAEVNELAKLTPLKLAAQLLKIEAQFAPTQDQPEKPAPVTSKAPAPVQPVRRPAPAASAEPSDSDDMDTWLRKREAQVAKRRPR
jgi:hypothetical protein